MRTYKQNVLQAPKGPTAEREVDPTRRAGTQLLRPAATSPNCTIRPGRPLVRVPVSWLTSLPAHFLPLAPALNGRIAANWARQQKVDEIVETTNDIISRNNCAAAFLRKHALARDLCLEIDSIRAARLTTSAPVLWYRCQCSRDFTPQSESLKCCSSYQHNHLPVCLSACLSACPSARPSVYLGWPSSNARTRSLVLLLLFFRPIPDTIERGPKAILSLQELST